jgi:hypothetical protein
LLAHILDAPKDGGVPVVRIVVDRVAVDIEESEFILPLLPGEGGLDVRERRL